MKRIAICLMGQARGFKQTSKYVLEEFDFKEHDVQVDFFCHTWNTTSNFSPWNSAKGLTHLTENVERDIDDIHEELSIISPKSVSITTYEDMRPLFEEFYLDKSKLDKYTINAWGTFDDNRSLMTFNNFSFFSTLAGQFFSSTRSLNMAFEYQAANNFEYDCIVRWRYDLAVNNRPEEERYKFWTDLKPHTIYVNNLQTINGWITAADHWFAGTGSSMSYMRTLDVDYTREVASHITREERFINEYLMTNICRKYQLSMERKSFQVTPFRTGATTDMTWYEINNIALEFERAKRESMK